MNFLKTYSIHILLIIIILCLCINKNKNNDSFVRSRNSAVSLSYKTASYESASYSSSDSNFIQNNHIEIESKNSEKSKSKIEQETKLINGTINNINSFYISDKIGYNIVIKIPSEKVDNFINNVIKTEGKIINENFSITNVTKQYNDNENTIKNLSLRRDRLRELLKKSDKVDDILKIDRELTNVQNQLDNYLKTNKNIKDDIDLTTVNVVINPRVLLNSDWDVNSSFYKALKNLIIFSQKVFDMLLNLLLFIPYIILICVLYKIYKIIKIKK